MEGNLAALAYGHRIRGCFGHVGALHHEIPLRIRTDHVSIGGGEGSFPSTGRRGFLAIAYIEISLHLPRIFIDPAVGTVVAAGEGALEIVTMVIPGKKPMPGAAFWNGNAKWRDSVIDLG